MKHEVIGKTSCYQEEGIAVNMEWVSESDLIHFDLILYGSGVFQDSYPRVV